ncbi:MAG: orotidine-5'-phosphate decarboxylase [Candidatus Niyogibacteria bacterium]|nr:orotidine-5'-phosphate decarboxylase [Candidatus Niyogibacteria bacterium]
MNARDRIIVPLDMSDGERAWLTVNALRDCVSWFKVGLELMNMVGAPRAAGLVKRQGRNLMYDGKFADIPNTMTGAVKAAVSHGADMLTIHASAGWESICAAVAERGSAKILGVTVLTSLAETECLSIFGDMPDRKVLQFAHILSDSGADGIVCSPQEAQTIRGFSKFNSMIIVTPGVRPAWAAANDQKRAATPAEAIRAGADYLVIGRPILKPPPEIGSPKNAVERIVEEIESVK